MSSKWRNVKAVFRYVEGVDQPIVQPQLPLIYDLTSDPGETSGLLQVHEGGMGWMFAVVLAPVAEYKKSIAQYPAIETGAEFKGC